MPHDDKRFFLMDKGDVRKSKTNHKYANHTIPLSKFGCSFLNNVITLVAHRCVIFIASVNVCFYS